MIVLASVSRGLNLISFELLELDRVAHAATRVLAFMTARNPRHAFRAVTSECASHDCLLVDHLDVVRLSEHLCIVVHLLIAVNVD